MVRAGLLLDSCCGSGGGAVFLGTVPLTSAPVAAAIPKNLGLEKSVREVPLPPSKGLPSPAVPLPLPSVLRPFGGVLLVVRGAAGQTSGGTGGWGRV